MFGALVSQIGKDGRQDEDVDAGRSLWFIVGRPLGLGGFLYLHQRQPRG